MGLFYNGHKKLSNVNEFTKFDYSKKITEKDAKKCLDELNIDLETKKYTALQFAQGMNVELEHGSHNKFTNVSNNDTLTTAKITLAHLNEFPDYYDRLAIMELDSEKFWRDHKVYVLENEEKSGRFKEADALKAAKKLNIPWENVQYDIHQLLAGMNVELEHGKENDITNVTDDDPIKTAKIALAHLNKYPDYYVRLEVMEKEGEEYWKTRDKENIINEYGISLEDITEARNKLPNIKNKGINMVNVKYYPLNEPNIKAYSDSFNSVRHIRLTDEYEGVIMTYNKIPIGFINVNKETKCIQAFEINPEYRSQGYGERLLLYAISTLKCDNLTVSKSNSKAISLYEKVGFKKYKETNHQYFMSISSSPIKESGIISVLALAAIYAYICVNVANKAKSDAETLSDYLSEKWYIKNRETNKKSSLFPKKKIDKEIIDMIAKDYDVIDNTSNKITLRDNNKDYHYDVYNDKDQLIQTLTLKKCIELLNKKEECIELIEIAYDNKLMSDAKQIYEKYKSYVNNTLSKFKSCYRFKFNEYVDYKSKIDYISIGSYSIDNLKDDDIKEFQNTKDDLFDYLNTIKKDCEVYYPNSSNHDYILVTRKNTKNESALIEALSIADEEGVIVLEAASTKKYKCPYCEFREEKENLVYHVQDEHEDMIPENFTAARVVFNKINKKECGHCVICNRETPWDENTWKYKRMCGRDACKKKAADQAKANMKKKYGKEHLLDDPEYQNKMLKGRKISGTYIFKGDKKEYVGSYEKNALEFIDKVLNCTPDEIQTPGPVIEYMYNGKKHFWITDMYYVTANLAIDCKDGGSNPNTREMKEYREKQIAKEKAITEQGKYNYLRLTDNDFEQLLLALVEIKKQMLDGEDKGTVIKINEYTAVGAMCNPVGRSYATYIVPYYINNSFIGTGYCSNKFMSDLVILGDDSKLKKISPKEFIEKYKYKLLKSSSSNDVKEKITEALEKNKEVNVGFIYEAVTGSKFINPDQLYIDSNFEEELDFYSEFALELECKKYSLLEEFNEYIGKPNMSFECLNESSVGSISYREDINGYYLYNSENKRRSKYYDSTDLIPKQLFEILRRDY